MKKHKIKLVLLIFLLISSLAVTACEEAASRFTDTTINNLEEEVGGAAERSSQKAGDQAGGAICGAPIALALLFTGAPILLRSHKNGSRTNQRRASSRTKPEPATLKDKDL